MQESIKGNLTNALGNRELCGRFLVSSSYSTVVEADLALGGTKPLQNFVQPVPRLSASLRAPNRRSMTADRK
jgi:hypothetical protein